MAYVAGAVLPAAVTLGAGMRLGAGTTLRTPVAVAALIWPKAVALPVEMTVAAPIQLARGSLIPSMTWIELPGNQPVNLRPVVNGVQGRNWAVAPMLGAGALSWGLHLVAGADLGSADRRALNPASAGAIKLADTHAVKGFVAAESIGGIKLLYRSGNGLNDAFDPRGIDPFIATSSDARSGITLVPGDSAVYLETSGDLVLGGVGDPGRSQTPNQSAFSVGGMNYPGGGVNWFTLWTDHTAINLISAGGNLTPTTSSSEIPYRNSDHNAADGSITYPSILRVAALGGNIYYGVNALSYMRNDPNIVPAFVTLAPSTHGALEMLAADSIYAGQYSFNMSGSGVALPTPFNPAFIGSGAGFPVIKVSNTLPGTTPLALFAFGPNSAVIGISRDPNADAIRFYAREGDIVGLSTGETLISSSVEARFGTTPQPPSWCARAAISSARALRPA
ncbi:hypothetical protein OZ411_08495 [Bradyrhizobium sp. Arg237L]|uniref:hypothetical protein n=1 Tax=Bradyrhizobium sp. Arg237L TaxID=3003352 RepID=UPI00249DCC7A|nr:hypothetical protein [Bradyrhizobium sp. Arg237L]MDI4232849.1 hypothetical protein [Bradyrhizobium sp. Arg237L]